MDSSIHSASTQRTAIANVASGFLWLSILSFAVALYARITVNGKLDNLQSIWLGVSGLALTIVLDFVAVTLIGTRIRRAKNVYALFATIGFFAILPLWDAAWRFLSTAPSSVGWVIITIAIVSSVAGTLLRLQSLHRQAWKTNYYHVSERLDQQKGFWSLQTQKSKTLVDIDEHEITLWQTLGRWLQVLTSVRDKELLMG